MPDPKDVLPDAPEHGRPSNVGPAELGIDYQRLEARVLHGPRTRHRWPFDHNVYALRVFRKAGQRLTWAPPEPLGWAFHSVSRVFDWARSESARRRAEAFGGVCFQCGQPAEGLSSLCKTHRALRVFVVREWLDVQTRRR
jgi:hypothetical protein